MIGLTAQIKPAADGQRHGAAVQDLRAVRVDDYVQALVQRLHDTTRRRRKIDMTNSRFAVCMIGEAFSIEDKKTGERLGYYRTQVAAEKARDAFSRLYDDEIENGRVAG